MAQSKTVRARRSTARPKTSLVPALASWDVFAGGTGAAPDKHAYGLRIGPQGEGSMRTQFSVSPVSFHNGRHRGYVLTGWGFADFSGHVWIDPDGEGASFGYLPEQLHRSPQSAVTAARKFIGKHPPDRA